MKIKILEKKMYTIKGIIGSAKTVLENLNNAGALKVIGSQASYGFVDLATTAANTAGGSRLACGDQPSGAASGGANQPGSTMTPNDNLHCLFAQLLNLVAGSRCQPNASCGCPPCGGA